ncbi:hypothetical protein VPNG_06351 [Cytospora leucostoma]|uniref:2EXR domain-containing protein n=1 Tax=Cytospora leucostoma TaxID=1230097 RepID=A0A423X260_9PEZI|nr:hypothetical protein VPNG_06351 [Cytospora leucostoma]
MSSVQQNMAQQVGHNGEQMADNNEASACVTYFLELPKELRLQVWELCLPKRVVKKGYSKSRRSHICTDISLSPPPRPPWIAHVNREAREVALAFGSIAEVKQFRAGEDTETVWKDTSTDLVHDNIWPVKSSSFERAYSHYFLSWASTCSHKDAEGGKQIITFRNRITLRLTDEEIIECELFGLFGEVCSILVQQGDQKQITKVAQLVKKSGMDPGEKGRALSAL